LAEPNFIGGITHQARSANLAFIHSKTPASYFIHSHRPLRQTTDFPSPFTTAPYDHPFPIDAAEDVTANGESRRALSECRQRRRELRSRPLAVRPQGKPAQRAGVVGVAFLCFLSLAKQRKEVASRTRPTKPRPK
jgi:hypothetical protein